MSTYIESRTEGFDDLRRLAAAYWPERVEALTGVPQAQLIEAARMLGRARTAMVLTSRGAEQQSHGVDNVLAFINVALALGKVGQPFSGYGTLTGQGNGQGGREHGQKADQLPGYRRIDDPRRAAIVAAVWGIPETRSAGTRQVGLRADRIRGRGRRHSRPPRRRIESDRLGAECERR